MTSMRRTHVLAAFVLAFALLAAACGGDDDSSSNGGSSSDESVPACLEFADLYALSGPESEGVDNWKDAEALATELGSTTTFPDLPLNITAPGEESGTYGSYIELALQSIGEERAAAGTITEDEAETTRKDYESSGNDNVIIDGIGGREGSFGWVGFAFADQNRDTVRLLEIDGGEGCVAPTPETIGSGEYPLSRTLYIYVNKAKAEENGAVAAYVDYYLSDNGYAAVQAADYIQLPEARWEETRSTWETAGIAAPGSSVSGQVKISGSSTVEPISGLVAEEFSGENPDVAIDVQGPGTSDGFEQFCNGEIDISDASRAIDEEEIAACETKGIEFIELPIGIDGLSVITRA